MAGRLLNAGREPGRWQKPCRAFVDQSDDICPRWHGRPPGSRFFIYRSVNLWSPFEWRAAGNAMDADVLKIGGQVAGIGGLALGVFLLLFRDIIRKNIFPKLPPAEAYRLLRLITVAVWSVAIVGIGAWLYTIQARQPSHDGTVIQHTDGSNSPAQNGSGNSVIINDKP
jgi:hypothetical protein